MHSHMHIAAAPQTHTQAQTHSNAHTDTQTHLNTRIHLHTNTCSHMHRDTCIDRTHTHTNIVVLLHTQTHTHTHLSPQSPAHQSEDLLRGPLETSSGPLAFNKQGARGSILKCSNVQIQLRFINLHSENDLKRYIFHYTLFTAYSLGTQDM